MKISLILLSLIISMSLSVSIPSAEAETECFKKFSKIFTAEIARGTIAPEYRKQLLINGHQSPGIEIESSPEDSWVKVSFFLKETPDSRPFASLEIAFTERFLEVQLYGFQMLNILKSTRPSGKLPGIGLENLKFGWQSLLEILKESGVQIVEVHPANHQLSVLYRRFLGFVPRSEISIQFYQQLDTREVGDDQLQLAGRPWIQENISQLRTNPQVWSAFVADETSASSLKFYIR